MDKYLENGGYGEKNLRSEENGPKTEIDKQKLRKSNRTRQMGGWMDGINIWMDGYGWVDGWIWMDGSGWHYIYIWMDGYGWMALYIWMDGWMDGWMGGGDGVAQLVESWTRDPKT